MTQGFSRRRFCAAVAAAASYDVTGGWAATAARFATGLLSPSQCFAWFGIKTGIFRRLGIEAALAATETAGPRAVAGLVEREWEFAEVGSAPIVQAVLKGHDAVILATALNPSTETRYPVRAGITSPKQLDGGRFGVLTVAGQTGLGAADAMRKWGIKAELVELKSLPRIYAALGAGEIDAGALPAEYRLAGQRAFGFNDLAVESPGYLPPGLNTTRRLIAGNRDLVANVVRGYVEAIHFFKTRRGEAIELLREFLPDFAREAAAEIYDFYAPNFLSLPLPSFDGLRAIAGFYAGGYTEARTLPLLGYIDTSFLAELSASGFIGRLYR